MVKGATELSGLRDVKTLHSSKKRSIPRAQSSAYLDLYMLRKEKDRLEKEVFILEKKKRGIQKRLVDIEKEMDKLEKLEAAKRKTSAEGSNIPQEKDWKTVPLKY